MTNVLMIEDDLEIAEFLADYLIKQNIKVKNIDSPFVALSELRLRPYDLVILDLSLPDMDGTEVCREIRKESDIPIIISSARSDISDKAICFAYGADDYMPKPYESAELVLRIHSLLKRSKNQKAVQEEEQPEPVFTYNSDKMEIYKRGEALNMTNAEFAIMEYFIKKSGFVVSREELLLNVDSVNYESTLKSIDVLVSRIRSKIQDSPKSPKHILSIRGIGYKLVNQ
jgi:two-component system OmpR family response regulator